MSKAVLLSIQPKWCSLIASGQKTIEVRKTAPNLETPFKVYIYETMGHSDTPWMDEDGHMIFRGRGNVIGEFTCKSIPQYMPLGPERHYYKLCYDSSYEPLNYESACLTEQELKEYSKLGSVFCWHISDLKIYDKPKEISEFTYLRKTKFGSEPVQLSRAPQSWCYVEELYDT